MGDFSSGPKTSVLVTGYGPFGNHVINASWESVKALKTLGMEDINLITQLVPVEYQYVKDEIPKIVKDTDPQLVVHVGVSGIAKELTLEQQAHNSCYDKYDVKGQLPPDHLCVHGGKECIRSQLDMHSVAKEINESPCPVSSIVSYDAGRYLCDFIYYTSLNCARCKVAFIHVPPLHRPYTAEQLAQGLKCAIKSMLKQTT